jgi:DNA gyrase/topoisomerase IV subunit B
MYSCMYIYVFMYICIYIYMYIHMYVYIYILKVYIYMYVCKYVYFRFIDMYIYTYRIEVYRHDGGIKELVKILCEGKANLHPDVDVITIAEERKGVMVEVSLR